MTESACIVNTPSMKFMSKTLGPLKAISATLGFVKLDKDVIYNKIQVYLGRLTPASTQEENGTDKISDSSDAEQLRTEDTTDNNNAQAISEFLAQHIVQHIGTGDRMKYFVRTYGFCTDKHNVEPRKGTMPQNFIALYWSQMNKQMLRSQQE